MLFSCSCKLFKCSVLHKYGSTFVVSNEVSPCSLMPGGKKCPGCKLRIYHEKWKVTPELAEARWAHKQAKDRELGEVVDFLGDLAV